MKSTISCMCVCMLVPVCVCVRGDGVLEALFPLPLLSKGDIRLLTEMCLSLLFLCAASSILPFNGENWGVLASVLGAAVVLGVTAACCRHIRSKRRRSLDELYELNEGPYVNKYGTVIS